MKILHISHCDVSGGANRAGYRIFDAQWTTGMDASMAVAIKLSDHPAVFETSSQFGKLCARVRPSIENTINTRLKLVRDEAFSTNLLPGSLIPRELIEQADIINLHFTGGSPFSLSAMKSWRRPIVWTLHDMWAMTPGEHYCPDGDVAVDVSNLSRLHRYFFRRKSEIYKSLDLSIVCPSQWLADCARRSTLLQEFPIRVIPYPINLDVYKPLSQHCARESLGLPLDRKLVLFGADRGSATGSRKGFDLLKKALWELHERRSDFDIVLFGQRRFPLEDLPPVVAHFPGSMSDDVSLALLYSAADVFVAPSRQDNLPNTVIESLACGTPVVAFNIGGMPDMIQHSGNGYLAAPFDVGDLAQGIHLTIDLAVSDRDALSERCRQSALQSFSPNSVAKSYQEIYRGIMAR